MVTLKDVADACGLSHSTVSKALNGYADVSEKTAELIRKTAEKMGYLPNVAARSLKTNRTYNIGILFSDELGTGLRHEYFSGILNSFKEQAEEHGYHITFLSGNLGGQRMTYIEQCRYRNFDGVMVAWTDYDDAQISDVIKSDLPVVTIDYAFENCTAVLSDNIGGMKQLVKEILDRGHTDIAYIHGEMTSVTKKRLASFYKTCSECGIEIRSDRVLQARYRDAELCSVLTEKLLEDDERPTCILYPDDYALIGGMNKIKDMGLSIPGDISIAGYDGSFLAGLISPKITTIKQDSEKIGKVAATKLIEAIENPKTWIPEQIIVPGSFIQGESVTDI